MGRREFRASAALAAVLTLTLGWGQTAHAQFGYFYPGGYGGYGWGGWGASTVGGDYARGMGVYAAGAGIYNQQTAVANSINADTVMRWNQYWWESQVAANRAERARIAQRAEKNTKALGEIETRLRTQPTERDIQQGDALNVAVEQINDPRVYTKALAAAKTKLPGDLVRNIPFQYAAQAISTSVQQITKGGPPALLRSPEFEAERAEVRKLADEIRDDIDNSRPIDQADLKAVQEKLQALRQKFEATVKRNTPGFAEADRFLKAAYGLTRMLETPAIDVLLSGVEKRPEVTVAELLTFMASFNLRFGPATSPTQRQAYTTLWPILDKLRDETVTALADAGTPTGKGGDISTTAGEFFGGMEHGDIQKKPAAPPAPPAPK